MFQNRLLKAIILGYFLIFGITLIAQIKDCSIDYEQKTDTTYIKKTNNVLVYERVFGNSKELVFFSLINSDGIALLEVQQIQKSTDFIPSFCVDKNSKIIFQLENGKFVTLIHSKNNVCSTLNYDNESKSNIRILTSYFYFARENFEELKVSPLSIMRIKYVGDKKDIILKNKIESEMMKETYIPSNYFIDYLHCIDTK